MTKKKVKVGSNTLALNKRARHEYFIEDEIEAGLELQGWEVKSMRAGKANISDSYIIFKNGEAYLFGATIQPKRAHHSCKKFIASHDDIKWQRGPFTTRELSFQWLDTGFK